MNYNYNPINFIYDWNSWLPQKSSISGISAFIDPQYSDHIDYYSELFSYEMPNSFKGKIIFDYFRKKLLSDYLRKTDMMSMLNGIEGRVPFLDEDLSKLAFSIPFDQKSNIFNGKTIDEYYERIDNANDRLSIKRGRGGVDTEFPRVIRKVGQRWGEGTFQVPFQIPEGVQNVINLTNEIA